MIIIRTYGYYPVGFTSSTYSILENIIIDSLVLEYGGIVPNGKKFSISMAHSTIYLTPIYGNISTIIILRSVIKGKNSVKKVMCISELFRLKSIKK